MRGYRDRPNSEKVGPGIRLNAAGAERFITSDHILEPVFVLNVAEIWIFQELFALRKQTRLLRSLEPFSALVGLPFQCANASEIVGTNVRCHCLCLKQ